MQKKILYSILFVVLAVGTFYSWQKVDFDRKAGMFFQVVFGGETPRAGRGRRPLATQDRGGEMTRPPDQTSGPMLQEGASGRPPVGKRGGPRSSFAQEGNRGAGTPGLQGKERGRGSVISLGKVAAYAVLMAFVVMIVRLLCRWSFNIKRTKHYV